MKSYAIRTAKKLSHDADFTLQETLRFRSSVGDDLKRSSELKSHLDSLNGALASLRDANSRLASNKSADDLELQHKIEGLKQRIAEQAAQAQEESDSLKSLDATHAALDEKLAHLHQLGGKRMAQITADLEMYSRHLGVSLEKEGGGFRLTFQDLGESVMLKFINVSQASIEGLAEPLEADLSDPLAICKLLYKARETVKI